MDIIFIGRIIHSFFQEVDIIYIGHITSYLDRNFHPILHIYSSNKSDWYNLLVRTMQHYYHNNNIKISVYNNNKFMALSLARMTEYITINE